MRLGAVLFLAHLLILALCFSYPLEQVGKRLRTAYLESAEEPLVDTANLMAAFVGQQIEEGNFSAEEFYRVFEEARGRKVAARIYEMRKDSVDLSVYITDAKGIVLFDSDNRETIGEDFSLWRDVKLTLEGEYGARVRRDPNNPDAPAALFVAAPIRVAGKIAGVLTVIKPTTNIAAFVSAAMPRIFRIGAISLASAIILGLGVSMWVTRQVGRLTRYANNVREGRRVPFPKLARTELKTMGIAFEKMREALDGRAYVEQYVEALTHEIKSPISAIRGAAEIMEDSSITTEQRIRFLSNIQSETHRIQGLVDRMLKLTELEGRRELGSRVPVALAAIVRTIRDGAAPALAKKGLRVDSDVAETITVAGDPLLLDLAVSNLVQNAIDFSPRNGRIAVTCKRDGARIELCIDDEGPGIPEFARSRVFEKFFSLERPETGKKSTGLGLNFAKEVAALHGGSVDINNLPERGLRARLVLPAWL
ncbi:MAG: two-component system sensor histidine kinase CreC [Acidobacteria bacterium 13_1_40CM_3_56_11]|nr:MAG: two-component system sensor histidine kinase CreC [Acidobacteria bacterium 13_1_40CM_3_56_11]